MATLEPTIIIDGLMFPEGPRWHAGRLYYSDMAAREVAALDMQGNREVIARVPGRPSGLGVLRDGSWLVVSMADRQLLRFSRGELQPFADLSPFAGGDCNDMVVDARDRAYVGNFGFDFAGGGEFKPTCLVLVTPDRQVRKVADDMLFPNGMAITPDGRTLIVAESYGVRLTAFDIAADGSLSGRRVWAQLPCPPDGMCLDAEGCVWIANPMPPGGFLRVAEGGEIKARIDLPDRAGIACMLGGPERGSLFLLEAFVVDTHAAKPGNGRIRVVDVDVPGAGWPSD